MQRYNQSKIPQSDALLGLGRCWIDDSGSYVNHACVAADRLARRRAFDYMRMIELISTKHSVCLRWDVARVSPLAMITAAHVIARRSPGTEVNLEYFWGAWNREIFLNTAQAIARISKLAAYRTVIPFKQTKRLERSFSSIMHDEGALLATAFRMWERKEASSSVMDPHCLGLFLKYELIFHYSEKQHELVFGHVGNNSGALQVCGAAWAKKAIGLRCDRSQPDFEYDTRACYAYRTVFERGEPVLNHVRAVIRFEGKDPIWLPYRQLVLPGRDRFGAPVVMSICDIDQNLAIPFMAA